MNFNYEQTLTEITKKTLDSLGLNSAILTSSFDDREISILSHDITLEAFPVIFPTDTLDPYKLIVSPTKKGKLPSFHPFIEKFAEIAPDFGFSCTLNGVEISPSNSLSNNKYEKLEFKFSKENPFSCFNGDVLGSFFLSKDNEDVYLTFNGEKLIKVEFYSDIEKYLNDLLVFYSEQNVDGLFMELEEKYNDNVFGFFHYKNGEFGILLSNIDHRNLFDEKYDETIEKQIFVKDFDFDIIDEIIKLNFL